MANEIKRIVGLLVLCLLLIGCGGEEQVAEVDPTPEQPDQFPLSTEVVVEPTKQAFFFDGESRQTIDLVHALLVDDSIEYPAMAVIEIDEAYESETRVRFVVKLVSVIGHIDDETIKVTSDQAFDALKVAFDQQAKNAAIQEEAHYRELAKTTAERVKTLQDELQAFIQVTRGTAANDETRLERRKLDRRIEKALVDQIAAEKAVHDTSLRNDRERFVTLLRVK